MKKNLLYTICFAAFAISALPMSANDYLKIYFKDGHTERHYMHLVESISTTKYDLEGNLHSDYQMQQIVMPDTTYSYYLADIDSMAFRKVVEEQVKNDVEAVSNFVTPIFEQCSTIDEMEEHLDEIKNMEGVEDVWCSGTDIVVQIRDWHRIIFTYPKVLEETENQFANIETALRKIKRQIPQKTDNKPLKVAIAFQMNDDSRFSQMKEWLIKMTYYFNAMGFDAHFIPDEKTGEILDVDFYKKRMYDYDIVIIETHGSYLKGVHSLYTSERTDFLSFFDALGNETWGDIDDEDIGCCHTGNNTSWVFKTISENLIKKTKGYKFEGDGPHIVFVGACETLKGNSILTREHNGICKKYYGNDSFARIFFDKGADVFMGYNNSTYRACGAACQYFENMLNGCSQEAAFYYLNDLYKDESDTEENAALIDLINPKSEYANPKSIFLFKTQTVEKTEQEIADEYKNTNRVELKALASCYDLSGLSELPYGFRLGKMPNVDKLEEYEYQELLSDNIHYTGKEVGQVEFSVIANPYPGMDIYYRAFTYDGIHYNWGEEKCFTIEKLVNLELSVESLCMSVGESSTIDITGNGSYFIHNNNYNVVKATRYGEQLVIEALAVGTATISVTDNKTEQKATIEITVIDPNQNVTHEFVDLGLPSGTLWATCNIGANSPEESGDFFAWGEVEPKEAYTWGTYKYCNGSENTMTKYCTDSSYGTVDNKKELDPEDDAATVKWGSNWQMPSIEQQTELINENYTTTTWTTEKGVYGRKVTSKKNGNYIFLPAAGYYSTAVYDTNGSGNYWSRSLSTKYVNRSRYLYFNAENIYYNYVERRYYGQSVRPVLSSAATLSVSQKAFSMETGGKKTVEILSGSGNYSVESSNRAVATAQLRGNFIDIYGVAPGSATIILTDVPTNQTTDITVTVRDPGANFCKDPNHPHMIDLGLPSGTKWACCNVGADIPEGYGNYYAWGETEPKDWYGYDTYIHCDGSKETCHDIGAEISGTQYDVAHVKWQGSWQMPTSAQIDELTHNCQHEMTNLNGVAGMLVTGPNGNQLFLPSAGFMSGKTLYHPEEYGLYKSGSRCDDDLAESWVLNADASAFVRIGIWNITGHTVRPVISGLELSSTGSLNIWLGNTETFSVKTGSGNYSVKSSNTSVATASISSALVSVKAMSVGTATITVNDNKTGQAASIKVIVKDPHQPETHEYVDLGLPSGTLWATCNVGADSPEEYGNYYAWGETKTKNVYNWETYIHSNGDSDVCADLGDISGTEYDVAHIEWGDDWRIPTYSECKELIDNCTSEWTSVGGVWGRKIIGANGNSIFLPAGGDIIDDKYDSQGQYGWYWTSHQFSGENVKFAHSIIFNQSIISLNGYVRLIGNLIRPVRKQ